jgi:hypothetical protein
MRSKRETVLNRIKALEIAIAKGRAYLETGEHADWRGFRPLFVAKQRNGKKLPPHPDWVRNVYVPKCERALSKAEKLLERLETT